jgi:hypothetical protein
MTTTVAAPALSYRALQQADGTVEALVGGPYEDYVKIRNQPGWGNMFTSLLWSLTVGTVLGLIGGVLAIVFLKFFFYWDWINNLFVEEKGEDLAKACHNNWSTIILLAIGGISALVDSRLNDDLSKLRKEKLQVTHAFQAIVCGAFAFLSAWLLIALFALFSYDGGSSADVHKGAVPLMSRFGPPVLWEGTDLPKYGGETDFDECTYM